MLGSLFEGSWFNLSKAGRQGYEMFGLNNSRLGLGLYRVDVGGGVANDTEADTGKVKEEDIYGADSKERAQRDKPKGLRPSTIGNEELPRSTSLGTEGRQNIGTLKEKDSKRKAGLKGTDIGGREDPIVGRG